MCVPWYGLIPWEGAEPDWSALQAKVVGHYASEDAFFTPDKARGLQQQLVDLGKDVTIHVYEGADHAFFNDTRPEVHDPEASQLTWSRTIELLRSELC